MSNVLCEFGKKTQSNTNKGPDTSIRRFRIMHIAIFDVVATIIGALLFAKLTGIRNSYSIVLAFALGIVAHRVFCIRSTVDKWLFDSVNKEIFLSK